jgi:hypothetical protein
MSGTMATCAVYRRGSMVTLGVKVSEKKLASEPKSAASSML